MFLPILPREEPITLIEHQPQIYRGLIAEMDAKINQLDNQLLQVKLAILNK